MRNEDKLLYNNIHSETDYVARKILLLEESVDRFQEKIDSIELPVVHKLNVSD